MGRLLTFAIIGFVIYLALRGFLKRREVDEATQARAPARGEDMVACARCGVNLPRSEAREEAGRWVCLGNPACR